ncbi:hypothetical protein CBS101457_005685 [Exobasidium rhododendri]|nr:hypothetical protein CBS101457_005685 [Exobasidium rhododendri]
MSGFVKQLADFTGLDNETVGTQIIPYLDSFPTKQALINHLQELLGPGSAQQAIIASYSNQRFPSVPAPAVTNNHRPSQSSTPKSLATDTPPPVLKSSNARKPKANYPTKLPPPRKIDADAYADMGAAYRKGHDEDLFSRSQKSSRAATPVESARVPTSTKSTPQPPPTESKTAASIPETTSRAVPSHVEKQSGVPSGGNEFIMIPTEEMKSLQNTISVLRGESAEDTVRRAKPCFCQCEL